MKIDKFFRLSSVSLCFGFLIPCAFAGTITTFNDKTTFLTTTGAVDATGTLPAISMGSATTATIGTVTFTAPRWEIAEHTLTLPGMEIGISNGTGDVDGDGNDGIDTAFASPVYAAGFDFMEPSVSNTADGIGCNIAVCVDSTFRITLKNGASIVNSFIFNAPDDVAAFVGVWSDTAFTNMDIREIVGTLDNEFYGHFYSGASAPVSVPEPATFLLFGLGLAGVLARRVVRPFDYCG